MSAVKDLVEYVVKTLADEPGSIVVSEIEGETTLTIEVRVSAGDMGRIIGRDGRTINALRTLARVLGAKVGKRVTVELL